MGSSGPGLAQKHHGPANESVIISSLSLQSHSCAPADAAGIAQLFFAAVCSCWLNHMASIWACVKFLFAAEVHGAQPCAQVDEYAGNARSNIFPIAVAANTTTTDNDIVVLNIVIVYSNGVLCHAESLSDKCAPAVHDGLLVL